MTKELTQHILAGFAGQHERILGRARAFLREYPAYKGRFVELNFWNMGSQDFAIYDRQEDRITEIRVIVLVPVQANYTGYQVMRQAEERIALPKELACGG